MRLLRRYKRGLGRRKSTECIGAAKVVSVADPICQPPQFATPRYKRKDLWRARLDPYGRAHVEVGEGFHQPLRWPGHYYDDEIGLCYNRFRYYDPELGRYIE